MINDLIYPKSAIKRNNEDDDDFYESEEFEYLPECFSVRFNPSGNMLAAGNLLIFDSLRVFKWNHCGLFH